MKYDLVFEGGGAKGIVLVGAYETFSKEGHTFGRLLGTSAGAITATLLAAGYSAQEMLDALSERENNKPVFSGFLGEPAPFDQMTINNSAVRDLLPERRDLDELPVVDGDATTIEVAAVMARMHSPVVAVVEGERLLGAITVRRLLDHLLPA